MAVTTIYLLGANIINVFFYAVLSIILADSLTYQRVGAAERERRKRTTERYALFSFSFYINFISTDR